MKTATAKAAIAKPRVLLSNMSAKAAATTANGQEPKRPSKKRQIMMVWISLAVATAVAKRAKPKHPTINGGRRPISSDLH